MDTSYRIAGLDPAPYTRLFGLAEQELATQGAVRMVATEKPSFPCRIRLDDADVGTSLLLINHVSHDVANPYRACHAIFVSEGAREPAEFIDEMPPALDRRTLSLRAFDAAGMMVDAKLAEPGTADAGIRNLLGNGEVAYIHAHNAVRGCFAAKVERWK